MNSTDIELLLRGSLDTIKVLGGTSIMSRKAHRCLNRYRYFLKSFGTYTRLEIMKWPVMLTRLTVASIEDQNNPDQPPIPTAFPDAKWIPPPANEALQQGFVPGMIESCMDDMFGGVSQNDIMDTGFFGTGQGISDFDAAGFI